MREFAGLRIETFDIRWVSTRNRVSVNSALWLHARFVEVGLDSLHQVWMLRSCRHFWTMRDARKHLHQPWGSLDRGSFARFISIVNMVLGVVSGWTTCDTNTFFYTTFIVFYALQETDKLEDICDECAWGISCMVVIIAQQPLGAHEKSLVFVGLGVDYEKRTTILEGTSMLLSVEFPHSGGPHGGARGRAEQS